MLGVRGAILLALAAFGALLGGTWAARARRTRASESAETPPPAPGHRETPRGWPSRTELAIGGVTNFFDTLGIGSFAPTTSIFRLLRLVPDRLLPGTLIVGHSFPTLAQAFIYITIIEVEMATLALAIAASVAGAWLGAGVVAGWPQRRVRVGMGCALLGAAAVMLAGMVGLVPAGGDALGLSGPHLALALAGNFALGALMTIGIGAYAPSLILFGLLGMNLKAVFPIMMGSCAFLMPASGIRFIRRGAFAHSTALGLALGGVPAVLVAAFLVHELPLSALRWIVLAIVVYTAASMLKSEPR